MNKCPWCHSDKSSKHLNAEHFQGYLFKCGSTPAHRWAGKYYGFMRTAMCYELEIDELSTQLSFKSTRITRLRAIIKQAREYDHVVVQWAKRDIRRWEAEKK